MDAPTVTLGGVEATLAEPSPLFVIELASSGREYMTATPILEEDGTPALDDNGQPRMRIEVEEPPSASMAIWAACLAATWPELRAWPVHPRRPPTWMAGQRIATFGHPIYDALIRGGVEPAQVAVMGRQARTWCLSTFISASEVEEAEGFSAAPTEG